MEQRQAQRKMLICVAVCVPLFFFALLILFIVPIGQADKTFIITILPIPYTIILLCCHRWLYYRSYNTITTTAIIVVVVIFCALSITIALRSYRVRVDTERKAQEIFSQQLLPLVPPPVDYSLPL